MRSINYANREASFTPLEPQHMLRAALVEGMKKKYEYGERRRYQRLLGEYFESQEELKSKSKGILSKKEFLYQLFDLFSKKELKGKQFGFLHHLLQYVEHNRKNWKPFDYDHLKEEGVIVNYDGENSGLAKKIQEIDENKVVFTTSNILDPNTDYLKHLHWSRKLTLNGYDVIKKFAEKKGFNLPESYHKNKKPTENVYQLLEEHSFTFREALKTAVEVLKDPKYRNRKISALVIKNPNGNELRLHHHDIVEAAEYFWYLYRAKELKQIVGEDKYHGGNKFLVPKRIPENGKEVNVVETHYLPEFATYFPKRTLEWFNTLTWCNCEHGFNLRNFEERRGRKTYVIDTFDTHSGVLMLKKIWGLKRNANKCPQNLNPLTTEEFSKAIDKLRYNLVVVTDAERKYANEREIEVLINELFKDPLWTFKRAYQPKQKLKDFVLRPMH